MSLNNIRFTKYLIADFYKKSLIESNHEESLISLNKETVTWKFLGENRKNILIIVNYPKVAYVPDAQLSFLTKLLTACKLNLGDVALINFNTYPNLNFNDAVFFFKSKIVFLFGVGPETLGMPILFPHFQIQAFNNCTYLFTHVLEEIDTDKLLKSKFWICLKNIFNL